MSLHLISRVLIDFSSVRHLHVYCAWPSQKPPDAFQFATPSFFLDSFALIHTLFTPATAATTFFPHTALLPLLWCPCLRPSRSCGMECSKSMQQQTQSRNAAAPTIPPPTRYQFTFPSSLEQAFSTFDDFFISFCQRRTDGPVHFFSVALTFFTSIEFALVAPPTLYALGYDSAAGLCSSVLFVLGVISQVPKKFIYRLRPWMVGRALPIRQDTTSSFPSRAVVCAVVFTWLSAWSLHIEGMLTQPISAVLLWLCIVLVVFLTSFARINVGAHYPSDTLLGFVLGCFVVNIGKRLEVWMHATCVPITSYPGQHTLILNTWSHVLKATPYCSLSRITFLSYAMTLVSIQGFWVKCSYVYGLLLSSMAFRVTYLCASRGSDITQIAGVSQVTDPVSFREHVQAAATMCVVLFFGMSTRGRKGTFRIVAFTMIYFGTLVLILSWRLRTPDTLGV